MSVITKFNHLPQMREQVRQRAVEAVRNASYSVETHAKDAVPVDTGTLKNSIATEFEPSGLVGLISPHTEYAIYVEYGTRRMRAQPYMRPAAERVRPAFEAAMRKIAD